MSKFTVLASNLRKIAQGLETEQSATEEEEPVIQDYRKLLMKMQGKNVLGKLSVLFDNPRLRKNDLYWSKMLDSATGSEADANDVIKKLKKLMQANLPVFSFLKKLLEFGIENGAIALSRILDKNRVRMTIAKEDKE
jgi:hypothetical protein